MDIDLLTRLRSVDTPTVCNAIEVAQGRRGFDAFTRGAVLSSAPHEGAVVGYAATAKIAAREASTEAPEALRGRRLAYYRMMAEAPTPSVAVVEDLDYPNCVGAFWGQINTTVHKGFGLAGAVTNGVMRDLGDLPDGFPVIAGSIGPSHAFVHVREIGTPVTVFGLVVSPGDLIHADRHGAVVVPADVIPILSGAIAKQQATERSYSTLRDHQTSTARFETAWAAFERARV